MVGAGLLVRTLKENLHTAMAFAYVRPDRTREGIGRRLVRGARGDRRGRRSYDDPERGLPPAGRVRHRAGGVRAARMGYEVASRESIKELTLADYVARRDALAASGPVAGRLPGHHLRHGVPRRAPRRRSAGCSGMLMSEVPLGELDLEASEWTPERIRDGRAAAGSASGGTC